MQITGTNPGVAGKKPGGRGHAGGLAAGARLCAWVGPTAPDGAADVPPLGRSGGAAAKLPPPHLLGWNHGEPLGAVSFEVSGTTGGVSSMGKEERCFHCSDGETKARWS
jgi:hypothetical protein